MERIEKKELIQLIDRKLKERNISANTAAELLGYSRNQITAILRKGAKKCLNCERFLRELDAIPVIKKNSLKRHLYEKYDTDMKKFLLDNPEISESMFYRCNNRTSRFTVHSFKLFEKAGLFCSKFIEIKKKLLIS